MRGTKKEEAMTIVKTLPNAFSAGALGMLLVSAPAIAEKMDCSYSKKSKQEISNQAIEPGDRPDRRMIQFVRVDVLSSKHPEWDGAEQMVYGHSDSVGGSATNAGYSVTTLKNGEKVWSKWEGVQYLVSKGGDAWELPFQGVFRFIAGTGRYKAIRGGGHYRGVATPAGLTQDSACEAEY
jgi:hypothetical protein